MISLTRGLGAVVADLRDIHVAFCLVGGLAVSVRAEPRFTRDLDLAVSVTSDADAEALVRDLLARGYETRSTVEQRATGRLATVRMWSPEPLGPIEVDLLFARSGVEPELCQGAEDIELVPGLVLPVAQPGHLVALKLLSTDPARPRDEDDLLRLREVVDEVELRRARMAVELIMERGTNRGRELRDAWAAWAASS